TWDLDKLRFGNGTTSSNTTNTIDPNGLNVPQQVLQSSLQTFTGTPNINYDIALGDGSYRVSLIFVEYFNLTPADRQFDVVLNGNTVATDYSIIVAAGGSNKATSLTFDVTATGGNGISVDLLKKSSGTTPTIAAIEITRINPVTPPWKASVD